MQITEDVGRAFGASVLATVIVLLDAEVAGFNTLERKDLE